MPGRRAEQVGVSDSNGIQGRTALVTGAGKGIGRAVSLRFAEMGVSVAVNYRASAKEAAEVVSTIEKGGGRSFAVQADVRRLDEVTAMVDRVHDAWGQIDILVNNAGIISDALLIRMPDDAWSEVIATNLHGTFYCTRAVLRNMLRRRWGRIINIGSVVGTRGNAGQVNYAASKAAVEGFSKALAKEVADRNITVNTVTPGYINTDTVDTLSQELKEQIRGRIPMGYFGEPDDVAHLVAFLATEKARYITGQIMSSDGGLAI